MFKFVNEIIKENSHIMKKHFIVIVLAFLWMGSLLNAQTVGEPFTTGKRYSVIIDNDFMGDPDGLFQLAHHVLSPSCDIKGIIGAHLNGNGRGFFANLQGKDEAEMSVNKVNEFLEVMGVQGQFQVVPGAPVKMTDSTKFCYDDDPWYCENGFGGLYTWATVMNFPAACDSFAIGSAKCPVEYDLMSNPFPEYQDRLSFVIHQGICPDGWHVMNREEWAMVLIGSGSRDGASYLGAVLWGSGNQRGFSLLPAGVLQTQWVDSPEKYIRYANIDVYADHWIPGDYDGSLVRDSTASYGNTVLITQDRINRAAGTKKVNGLSIRCVQDY